MCTTSDCARYMGQWVRFQTPWGMHRGIVSSMNNSAVLVRVPRAYAPIGLATSSKVHENNDEQRLDLALAWGGGYGGWGGGYRYGARAGWGAPGYGRWAGGWWWWWLAFAWIFALAFLW
ncbi:hypothetical protein JZ785_01995 [Alicyclobacillus curvatus]|jgi:hypothetical protein|nr:hypothetical protein JZ785_01995 [Alicyclobacillus curvatus]